MSLLPRSSVLSVSSYSLREQLGPISIDYTDPQGVDRTFAQEFPSVLSIADFPARAAAELGDLGLGGVETVAFQFDGPRDPRLDAFAAGAQRAGLTLVGAAVDVGDLLSPDPVRRSADVDALRVWVHRLADLGFGAVRVNPGSPFGAHDGGGPPAHLLEALVDLGTCARARGTRLLVENHGGPSSDPAWMGALLDAVGDDVGLLLDLGNFDALLEPLTRALFAGADHLADPFADPFDGVDLEPVHRGIEALAGRAELVHVKAHRVEDGPAGTVGPVDLGRALRTLRSHDYDGPLTVEYEGTGGDPWARTRRVLDLTAAAVAPTSAPA